MAALAAVALAGVGAGTVAAAKPGDRKPPKPKPKLTLLTETQDEVLRKGAIKVEVRSRRLDEARVKGTLVIGGYPDDFPFKLRPRSTRLRDGEGRVRFRLSSRQDEVLEFSAQACEDATLKLRARDGRRSKTGRLKAVLPPRDC